VIQIEEAIKHPNQPTDYFPPVMTMNIIRLYPK